MQGPAVPSHFLGPDIPWGMACSVIYFLAGFLWEWVSWADLLLSASNGRKDAVGNDDGLFVTMWLRRIQLWGQLINWD